MRQIKFRAWNGQSMMTVGSLELFTDETFYVNDEYPISNEKLMQFTGLLDKNGKEIYEGDVIHVSQAMSLPNGKIDPNRSEIVTKVVEWKYGVDCGFNLMGCVSEKGYEVIGNIYETPELLTPRPTVKE